LNKPITAVGVHRITAEFEQALCDYTGSPYAVAVDNASNGLFLCLMRENIKGMTIKIPCRTYPSVPCEILYAGGKIEWLPVSGKTLTGSYNLWPCRVWDSALSFSGDMYSTYVKGSLVCVSFSGPFKHLKLGKGGAILCDNVEDYEWLKRARNSGRGEMSYHDDVFTTIGRNCYMHPTVAALGLQLIGQYYNIDGSKKSNPDLTLSYPDLSKFDVYNK
jgi:dTDP-4-amino-4,6-dideoxygalactose transaminase